MSESRTGNGGDRGTVPAPMAPFDLWAQWIRENMGSMTAVPGASVPWLMSPGVSTAEEAEPLPEGAIRTDPLLSTIETLWDANPLHNLLPLNWAEITRSLQTLWARELNDPVRPAQRATEYNQPLFESSMVL